MGNVLWEHFTTPLWADIQEKDEFWSVQPHLAHYTSVANIERILASNEIWLSNPLYMNDHEEVAFGIHQGLRAVTESAEVARACKTLERHTLLLRAFDNCYQKFVNEHVLYWTRTFSVYPN
jgi:hypothetical protein